MIGGVNAGKSTVIRSFTGCRSGMFVGEIEERVRYSRIFVVAYSPQEKALPTLEPILRHVARTRAIRGIVIAIQPRRTRTRDSMEDVFQLARRCGQFSFYAFILDPPYRRRGTIDRADVRRRLRALGIGSVTVLDARRYPHKSAQDMQRISRML